MAEKWPLPRILSRDVSDCICQMGPGMGAKRCHPVLTAKVKIRLSK